MRHRIVVHVPQVLTISGNFDNQKQLDEMAHKVAAQQQHTMGFSPHLTAVLDPVPPPQPQKAAA